MDAFEMSCAGGWTCGNLIGAAADVARFTQALHAEGKIVSTSALDQMRTFAPLNLGWSIGLPYGLGMMDLSADIGMTPRTVMGHEGKTENTKCNHACKCVRNSTHSAHTQYTCSMYETCIAHANATHMQHICNIQHTCSTPAIYSNL